MTVYSDNVGIDDRVAKRPNVFARKDSSPEKVDGLKRNNLERILIEKVHRSLTCMATSFGRADESAQLRRTVKRGA